MSLKDPRVLIVTPEVTYLPDRMGNLSACLTAKAGGLADVSAALISALFDQGADVHVALPDYRSLFMDRLAPFLQKEQRTIRKIMSDDRVHLAEDRAFYYLDHVYSDYGMENTKLSLAFQREVINNIVPRVEPDLIHCNDWMTGLIPPMARQMGIPCLFTIHNVHTVKSTVAHIEDRGIDAAAFWKHLYFDFPSHDYETAREHNRVDFLVSGVFAAHFVNVVSPSFLLEIVQGKHPFVPDALRTELTHKYDAGCAVGILNAPDPAFDPRSDPHLFQTYGSDDCIPGKKKNKTALQKLLGLIEDPDAPLFFWPSRLDPNQKGCPLLADILYAVISKYWDKNLEILFVANGDYQQVFRNITKFHGFEKRVSVCDFSESLEHLGYAASDFILMPSLFEPCGLPQMIAPVYGSLPVAHKTGGIKDTIAHFDPKENTGNGFLFEVYDANGLFWAIDQAMQFFSTEDGRREKHLKRIMEESAETFTHAQSARQYIALYEKMLQRPLINPYV
ncbi:MAG: glycogen/starch synthase [Deltaproteobacteria bacterium]|nr:glycogen/starch synthase [Deltaproteobacteria bacterium]MBW1954927.1 glycogen/starch synthase [Deltaproteobacteria bacterium]MBW2041552.1 glycogen/starch synthase [Deltaproteobacteria bacterium]MBW2131726.1 glycogen/starch synthase [Deltaproteobacteria bacterium]